MDLLVYLATQFKNLLLHGAKYVCEPQIAALGGSVVVCLQFDTKFAGSNPAEDDGLFFPKDSPHC
jgi:hypothetical protein